MTGQEIALFTLLVTILGWFVTGFYQRRILKMQIESEREKEARQFYLPRQFKDVEDLSDWLKMCVTILSNVEENRLRSGRYLNIVEGWLSMYHKHLAIATSLDSRFTPIESQVKLTDMVNDYYALGRLLQDQCAGREGVEFNKEYSEALDKSMANYSRVTERLGYITEQIAMSKTHSKK